MEKMTQFEFDNMLNALRKEHEELAKPLRKQLEALNEEFAERKKALMKAFPNAKGMRKPDGYNARRESAKSRNITITATIW